jgi:hypothetical protein
MIEYLACCGVTIGGKFVVLATLFSIWMISLIVSRSRGQQPDQMEGLSGDDELRQAPRGPAGDDMTQDISYRPVSTKPAREIVTRADLMKVRVRPTTSQFIRLLIVVAIVAGLVSAGTLFAWFKLKDRLTFGESEDIRQGAAGETSAQPVESDDISVPRTTNEDDAGH